MIENRQCFVNIIAAICIFLFILLQYEESRFTRGPPIENYINSTFKDHYPTILADQNRFQKRFGKTFILPDRANVKSQNALEGLQPRYPETIIVGMQKCGTGALKEFMKRNPFVNWSEEGEAHFFDRGQNYEQGYDWYLNIQPKVISSTKVFDKTPSYMSDQIIPERIYNYYPDVKVIMLLCEPEHRTLSHFLHAVSLRDSHYNHAYLDKFGSYSDVINDGFNTMLTDYPEILSDLSDLSKPFTRFADLRDAVYRFMDNPDNYGAMHYPPIEILTRGAYAYYVHQYLKWFKREQILILNSNDLKYQPAQVLKQVQQFMGVPLAVDEKNFIMDEESGHFCIIGPEDLEPHCMSSSKNRSKDHEIKKETHIKLSRLYKALKPDLEDLVGIYQFADWIYEDV